MKVIATIGPERYLVEATADELAQIMGFSSNYYIPEKTAKICVGREIKVSKLYGALVVERSRSDELETTAAALRKTADKIDSINEALAEAIASPSS